jgi:hypothetical protein
MWRGPGVSSTALEVFSCWAETVSQVVLPLGLLPISLRLWTQQIQGRLLTRLFAPWLLAPKLPADSKVPCQLGDIDQLMNRHCGLEIGRLGRVEHAHNLLRHSRRVFMFRRNAGWSGGRGRWLDDGCVSARDLVHRWRAGRWLGHCERGPRARFISAVNAKERKGDSGWEQGGERRGEESSSMLTRAEGGGW